MSPPRDALDKMESKLDAALRSLGAVEQSGRAALQELSQQGKDLENLEKIVEILRNGEDGQSGMPLLVKLLDQRVVFLERVILLGGASLLVALLTSAIFWKTLLRSALE